MEQKAVEDYVARLSPADLVQLESGGGQGIAVVACQTIHRSKESPATGDSSPSIAAACLNATCERFWGSTSALPAAKTCIRNQSTVSCRQQNMFCGRQWRNVPLRPSDRCSTPGKPGSPTGLRGWRNQPSSAVPVEPDARRVACPCSTEARRRNPDRGSGFVSQDRRSE